jgi:hypothetical protein
MKPHLGTLVALLGIVVAASLPAEPRRAITQGEFAVLLVQFLKLEPEREWTADGAVEALESSGIEPGAGWSAGEPLTESVLVELIRPAQMPVLTPDPERQVTRLEAMAVFHRIRNLYSRSFFPNRTPSGTTLTGIEGAKGHPAPGGPRVE